MNNFLIMNKFMKNSKGVFSLAFIIFFIGIINGQNSPWQLEIGYGQVFINSRMTNNLAQKNWVWYDVNRGDLLSMKTSQTHMADLGIRYDVFNWWSLNLDFKQMHRRYYIWSGTYLSEDNGNFSAGEYNIIPYVNGFGLPDMFLGRTLRSNSWQIGTEFSHCFEKSHTWKIHYFVSLSRDQYEVDLDAFDTDVNYGNSGFYTDINTGQRVNYEYFGDFSLKSDNPGRSGYQGSTNFGLAISRKLFNGMGLRLEIGYRNILWTKNIQLDENHWEIDLRYEEYADQSGELTYSNSVVHEFPLEIAGIYTNIAFTFRPFRSRRDK